MSKPVAFNDNPFDRRTLYSASDVREAMLQIIEDQHPELVDGQRRIRVDEMTPALAADLYRVGLGELVRSEQVLGAIAADEGLGTRELSENLARGLLSAARLASAGAIDLSEVASKATKLRPLTLLSYVDALLQAIHGFTSSSRTADLSPELKELRLQNLASIIGARLTRVTDLSELSDLDLAGGRGFAKVTARSFQNHEPVWRLDRGGETVLVCHGPSPEFQFDHYRGAGDDSTTKASALRQYLGSGSDSALTELATMLG